MGEWSYMFTILNIVIRSSVDTFTLLPLYPRRNSLLFLLDMRLCRRLEPIYTAQKTETCIY
jgi:hypothetical protein